MKDENETKKSATVHEQSGPASTAGSALAVTAKTAAGAGLGLIVILGGAAAVTVLAETVLIPSLLAKVAAGIAGGGLGLAKGMADERKPR